MNKIIETMSLEEKLGQLFMSTYESDSVNGDIINLITTYHIGGVLLTLSNSIKIKKISHMNKYLQLYATNKRPLFIANKQNDVNDHADLFVMPIEEQLHQIGNRLYTKQFAELTALEHRLIGINTIIYPNLSVSNSERIENKVDTIANHSVATVQGMKKNNVIACATGFPANEEINSLINPDSRKSNVYPFYKVINNGVDAISVDHPDEQLINDYIRKTLQFKHMIIHELADETSSPQAIAHRIIDIIHAGVNMIVLPYNYKHQLAILNNVIELGKEGHIDFERVDDSLNILLTMKKRYKLNELMQLENDNKQSHYETKMKEKLNEKLSEIQ